MKPNTGQDVIDRAQKLISALVCNDGPTKEEEYDIGCLFSLVMLLRDQHDITTDVIINLAFRAAYNVGRTHANATQSGDDILRRLNEGNNEKV
jgi:hypothetical protein